VACAPSLSLPKAWASCPVSASPSLGTFRTGKTLP
jgi:hypothetical protein